MAAEMTNPSATEQSGDDRRKVWSPPVIEDADIGALTHGSGTSGLEGTSFLKAGS